LKVQIDCDKRVKERGSSEYVGGWYFFTRHGQYPDETILKCDERYETYDDCRRAVRARGLTFDNAGWKRKLLMWNWTSHSLDGYPGWEIENPEADRYQRHPAYARVEHVNKKTKGSDDLCNAWDDIAEVDFYQRDFSYDGSIFVNDGDRYGSGWWFATVAERDRFLKWVEEMMK
jgi:hypothetical protein